MTRAGKAESRHGPKQLGSGEAVFSRVQGWRPTTTADPGFMAAVFALSSPQAEGGYSGSAPGVRTFRTLRAHGGATVQGLERSGWQSGWAPQHAWEWIIPASSNVDPIRDKPSARAVAYRAG